MFDPNWQETQYQVFLAMLLTFGIGWLFVRRSRQGPKTGTPFDDGLPLTRREREIGARFIPSWSYRRYRNPMKALRRWCGWPSGRQWKKLYKQWNREVPDGARKLAGVVSRVSYPSSTPRKKEEL